MKPVGRLLLCLYFIGISSLWATELFDTRPLKVVTASEGLLHWDRAEAYRDRHLSFGKEKILEVSKFKNPQVLSCFPESLYDNDAADSSLMVLLYGAGWDVSKKTPVLLIHGAGDDAFRAWVHPYVAETPKVVPFEQEGFLQKFQRAGYPVFAINFSHNHGCNYRQAEQIHNAVQVIKAKTGSAKVHIVAHSKGNCAASIYACGGRDMATEKHSFLSPYKKDISTYVQLTPANKGIDLTFRYYTANLMTISNKAAAPLCFYSAVVYGTWTDFYKEDVYKSNPGKEVGNYFPGQCQVLGDLVADGLALSPQSYTPGDLNLTMQVCYYGGQSMFVASYGIRHAIAEGDHTISRINQRGLDPSISLVNMYGTNQVIQKIPFGFFEIPVGVSDYPSDGVVYEHSARYIKGLLCRGARLLGQKGFDMNHVNVARQQQAFEWMEAQLRKAN